MAKEVTLTATSAMGLESVVAKEVKKLGYDPVSENGRVIFEAPISAIARCNLWLRTADRLKLVVGEFEATTFDNLFEQTKALEWERYLPEDAAFPVSGKSHKSTLYSVPDCQSIVKKAIVDRLKRKHGVAKNMPETGATYKTEVAILKDKVTLSLDTSGNGLHKRGYRIDQGEAPLKETLAAALIMLTNWRPDEPFVDPFCGSGTIPIEAALIGQNIAPGFNREFAAEDWSFMKTAVWDRALEEAEDLANYDQPLSIEGSDINHKMIGIANQNALEAGLGDLVSWKQMQVKDLTLRKSNGYVIGNPPYGERIKDKDYVANLYQELGSVMKQHPSWSVYVLTSFKAFEK